MSDRLDRIESLIESNAKSIEALTNQASQDSALYRKDRAHVFEWMARLAAAQADFYEAQSDYLDHLQKIDNKLTAILEHLQSDRR
jgi:hypothetical protein